ncbi:MAG: hypothetical protein HQ501_00485 [Rhodospirillales bacterium]|nr:hypothetical protein [Rhodospirillales bacterium]
MDFIFMLTHGDKTIDNCLEVFDEIKNTGVTHIGFKDIGVDKDTLSTLARRIKDAGSICYLEVVSTTLEEVQESIKTAVEIGIDRVLGGQDVEYALSALNGSAATYYPFPGRPIGHPTNLEGSPKDIESDCARYRAAGCPGVDLLAYRATDSDPLDLIRAARAGLDDGYLIVAGSIDSPKRIAAIAEAGADAFTIGTAVFDNAFASGGNTISYQCQEILKACDSVG